MGSLSFDSMSIKNKVKFDPHSNELVGFAEGALKEDVLLRELVALDATTAVKSNCARNYHSSLWISFLHHEMWKVLK